MNRWMNDPQYLAQVGHFFGAYSVVITTTLLTQRFGWSSTVFFVVLALLVLCAALKEFWYDMRYELPRQTWADSTIDFIFYLLGAILASGVTICLRR